MPIISTNTLYTHGYNIINGKIGIRTGLTKHFDIDAFVGVDNITNSQFPYMIFINQLPDAYVPAPKTSNIYAGLDIQYNF
jgi:iron complex outermembrane receptor protein